MYLETKDGTREVTLMKEGEKGVRKRTLFYIQKATLKGHF